MSLTEEINPVIGLWIREIQELDFLIKIPFKTLTNIKNTNTCHYISYASFIAHSSWSLEFIIFSNRLRIYVC